MPTCSFCKKHYDSPRGLTVFTFDGRSIHFCSSKCKRNLDLKRDPKKVNWIKREKKVKKVEIKAEKSSETKKVEVKAAEKKIDEKKIDEKKEKEVEKKEEKLVKKE